MNHSNNLSPLLQQSSKLEAASGEGCYLVDGSGQRYLDLTSGIGVLSTGHCHPAVVNAIREQAGRLIHAQYAIVRHSPMLKLAERLDGLTPSRINSFFFSNAGTEAVEASVRLARQASGKTNIIAFQGAFHGRTMGALSLTSSNAKVRHGVQPMMGGAVIAPFPDPYWYGWSEGRTTDFCLRELDRILMTQSTPEETAAIIIEPVQGEAGFVPAPASFLQGLRECCDRHGILLIFDEVQCGNGRSGSYWAHTPSGVVPDILVSAKGLASGMPLSFMGASRELMAKGWPGSQGGTYGGNVVACAAALATLDVIESERLVDNAREMGRFLRQRLEALSGLCPIIHDVRGIGLMQAVNIVDHDGQPSPSRAEALIKACEEGGLLLLRCGVHGNIVRWLPPLIVNQQQLHEAIEIFQGACNRI
ncbi:aspartate aminotransferase family protein [Marinobacter lacisalsi]|uniref:Aspartate aminotransferase family protein n=1 Tax=Marinobacter lacisalsi TaxID=475979 RepID=A0ABV8QF96_9GAMM